MRNVASGLSCRIYLRNSKRRYIPTFMQLERRRQDKATAVDLQWLEIVLQVQAGFALSSQPRAGLNSGQIPARSMDFHTICACGSSPRSAVHRGLACLKLARKHPRCNRCERQMLDRITSSIPLIFYLLSISYNERVIDFHAARNTKLTICNVLFFFDPSCPSKASSARSCQRGRPLDLQRRK